MRAKLSEYSESALVEQSYPLIDDLLNRIAFIEKSDSGIRRM